MQKFESFKKLVSLLLAVMIALSCVAVGVNAASNVKIAFTNNKSWDQVYLFAWDDDDNFLMGDWPGTRLTNSSRNEYGETVFYAEVPSNASGIVFNDGNGQETEDIAFSGQPTGWYISGKSGNNWQVSAWDYNPGGQSQASSAAPANSKTVYFTNNLGWSKVMAFAWDDDDESNLGDWPGTQMTWCYTNNSGHDVYKVILPENSVGVVFSDGGSNYTEDITPADNTGYYCITYSGSFWKVGIRDPGGYSEGTTIQNVSLPSTGMNTVYFTNTCDWDYVYAYAWDDDGNSFYGGWPGEEMTFDSINSYYQEVYRATFPESANHLLFSGIDRDNGYMVQAELVTPANNTGYFPKSFSNGEWKLGSWSPVKSGASEQTETDFYRPQKKVYLSLNPNYSDVRVYAWDKDEDPLTGDWPGALMNLEYVNDNSEKVYSYTLHQSVRGVVFNWVSSGERRQTVDIIPANNMGYRPAVIAYDDKWEVENWNPPVQATTVQSTTAKPTVKPTTVPPTTAKPTVKPTTVPPTTTKPTVKPTTVPPTTAKVTSAVGEKKVYFRKTSLWQNVSIFAWDEEYDPAFGDWPGTAMTNSFTGNDNEEYFYVTLPANAVGITFTCSSQSGGLLETVDIVPENNTCYIIGGKNNQGKYTVNTITSFSPESPTVKPTTVPPTTAKPTVKPTTVPPTTAKTTVKPTTSKVTSAVGEKKVYFRKTSLWQNVSIFAWDEEYDPAFGDWPGTAMTNSFTGNDNEEYFYVTLPANAVGITFTCNSQSGGLLETVDIVPENNTCYIIGGKNNQGKYTVNTISSFSPESPTVKPTTVPPTTAKPTVKPTTVPPTTAKVTSAAGEMKVFFRKTPLWQNVSIFAWDEEYDPTFGDWPGTAMTNSFIGNDGEEYFSVTLPANTVGIVFTCNFQAGVQFETVDIVPENDTCYIIGDINNQGKYTVNTKSPFENEGSGEWTVYFKNLLDWDEVKIYTWKENGKLCFEKWEVPISYAYENAFGEKIYKTTIPDYVVQVSFSNGAGNEWSAPAAAADNTGYRPLYTDETGCWILESWYPVEEENYSAEFEAYYAAEDFRPSSYSLSLKDNIAINFKVKPETIEGYSYPFLFVNYQQKWYQVHGYETLDDGTLVFEFDKILPQCYRDSATAYLCAEKDGKMYCGGGYEKRVSDYLINMQGKYSNKLDGLIVNPLRYITETQKYTGYDTDYLATNYIRTQSVPYAKKTLAPMEDVKNYHAQYCDGTIRAEFKSATLSLGSAVGIKVTFTADYSDDLLIKVDCNGESRYYWAYEFERTDNGKISFTYNLFANQMHDTVSFTICDGWDYTPVSDTLTYSAATYASKYINDPTIGSLLKELMLYGQAAESYAQDS